jgi:fucose permease
LIGSRETGTVTSRAASELLLLALAYLAFVGLGLPDGLLGVAWPYSLFTEARGASMAAGGRAATVFWTGLMLGRLGFGLGAGVGSVTPWLRACIAGAGGAAALLSADVGYATDLAAVGALGLACGPIFPSLIADTPARVGERHAANQIGMQVAGAAIGQSLLPAVVGSGARRLGLEAVGPSLVIAAGLLLSIHELLRRRPVVERTPSMPARETSA